MSRKLRFLMLLVQILTIVTACDINKTSRLTQFEDSKNIQHQNEEKIENINEEIDKSKQAKDYIKSVQESENNKIYSIVYPYKVDNKYSYAELIGGVTNSKWYNSYELNLPSITRDEVETDIVRENEQFRFYSKDSLIASKEIDKPGLMYYGILEESLLQISFEPFLCNNEYVIGTNSDWNALPRIPKEIDEDSYSIDLDGDGSNEIFTITKSNYVDEKGENLIKLDILITDSNFELIDLLEYYIYEEQIEFFELMHLDLNGDNKLEVIMISDRYGLSVRVYEFDKQKLVPVIYFYLGD